MVGIISLSDDVETDLGLLVKRASTGDHAAFRVIFDRLSNPVFSFALSHIGNRETAMDIVQETFIDVWKALPNFSYRSDKEFFSFIFMITRRKLARMHESKKRTAVSLDEIVERRGTDGGGFSDDREHFAEDHRHLMASMGKLSGDARELLALRYWSELSFAEIAAALRITENAAKVRHHRAIGELRKFIHHKDYYATN